jgi:protein-disulfide isomerase
MNKKSMQMAVFAVLILIVLGGVLFYLFKPRLPLPAAVAIDTTDQPTIGNAQAKIHIVAFEDLKCGNCMRYSTTIYPALKKKYIDTGKAKYTMINLGFVPGSLAAANAARCIYQQNPASFFDFVDYVYNNQPPEDQDWATIPALMQMASHVKGIDKQQLSECLVKSPNTTVIENNMSIAIKAMGEGVATPAIYVNGVAVQPVTLDRINEVINAVNSSN